jgi:hypothetical protein
MPTRPAFRTLMNAPLLQGFGIVGSMCLVTRWSRAKEYQESAAARLDSGEPVRGWELPSGGRLADPQTVFCRTWLSTCGQVRRGTIVGPQLKRAPPSHNGEAVITPSMRTAATSCSDRSVSLFCEYWFPAATALSVTLERLPLLDLGYPPAGARQDQAQGFQANYRGGATTLLSVGSGRLMGVTAPLIGAFTGARAVTHALSHEGTTDHDWLDAWIAQRLRLRPEAAPLAGGVASVSETVSPQAGAGSLTSAATTS